VSNRNRIIVLYSIMAALLLLVGFGQSWTLSLTILNLCLISAIMALGVNIQWGYAGLFNVGIMGFAALGGLAGIVVSMPPVPGAWSAGGTGIGLTIVALIGTIGLIVLARKNIHGKKGNFVAILIAIAGYFVIRHFFDPAVAAIESYDAARTGYLGGLGLPIIFSWLVGGVFAAGAAWMVGKIALGLRADYLAIATLGISEIIIAVLRNEEWLTRGVKNVSGLPRPVAYEVQLQQAPWFLELAANLNMNPIFASAVYVRLSYAILFAIVLIIVMFLAERALNSPWGRMMRAIRDNRDAAEAMGKDVTRRHLQVFVLGSAVVGIADDARRPVHPRPVPAAALHLPDLGDGDRRRVRQQLGCGARRLPDLVRLGRGRTGRRLGDVRPDVRHGPDEPSASPARRRRSLYAAADDGPDPAAGPAVQPARVDSRADRESQTLKLMKGAPRRPFRVCSLTRHPGRNRAQRDECRDPFREVDVTE
jgi:branched-chain amino acid transport system permease protein